MTQILSILMAMTAYACLAVGLVLMKKGIGWLGWKGPKDRSFYGSLAVWIAGFLVMNLYGVPNALALKILPPDVVAAFAGWGIVVLVFCSHFLLRESISRSDLVYSFLIVGGIAALNLFSRPEAAGEPDPAATVVLFFLPFVLFVCGLVFSWSDTLKTALFAAVSGLCAGLMVVALGLLVRRYEYQIALYLKSPYLYLYIGLGLLSLVALQVALKHGPLMVIGPIQYSTHIGYPLVAAMAVFRRPVHAVQYLAVGLIVYSVVGILRRR
jgi:multidrug transporter EmrE-like cation transporter